MSFIQFESAREKEKIREELRSAREELLKRAQQNAEARAEKQAQKTLSGEASWMLPDLEKKIDKRNKSAKKQKKVKKVSKEKKLKKKKKKRKCSSSDGSSDTEEEIPKKKKKKKRKMSTESSSSSSSSSDNDTHKDEWVEKTEPMVRDDWMTSPMMLKTFSKADKKPVKEKQHIDAYEPGKNSRELNPHWKNGGTGLPTFRKPSNDYEDDDMSRKELNSRKDGGNAFRKPRDCYEDSATLKGEFNTKRGDSENAFRKPRDDCEDFDYPRKESNRKDGGNSFRKPRDEYDDRRLDKYSKSNNAATGGWRKQSESTTSTSKNYVSSSSSSSSSETEEVENVKTETKPESSYCTSNFLTDQQMNELGAKIIKAEIMGNNELAEELKLKLESARVVREQTKNTQKQAFIKEKQTKHKEETSDEHILLTTTDSKGSSRPLLHRTENESDRYGGRRGKQKNKKSDTHVSGERVRYFPDDDKYDIKQMFEREKYTSAADSDAQFAEIAGKHKNPNDDLEDIFADKVRKNVDDHKNAGKEKQRAIYENERLTKTLDSCDKCFDSQKMEKQLLVSMGKNVYLSIPWHEGLQPNHCLIVPIQHVSCSTQLDEDVWEEISNYRKALTKMFSAHNQDVVFFETARYLHRRPHMVIHCVPARSMEMAPFYFKKAIQESEYEWSTNKQLVSLKDKSLRRAIPKGLPYFWVHFGMDTGFAHVIEDQEKFPSNFAQEIIGGMLHLDASRWRRPRKEHNIIPKVKNFADWWKPYDFTD